MRKSLLLILSLLMYGAYGQTYEVVDNKVRNYPAFQDINTLVIRVSNDFSSEEERVRAFYTWITHNVYYNHPAAMAIRNGVQRRTQIVNASSHGQKNRARQLAETAFQTKVALCGGLSQLFAELCSRTGIDARVVYGVSRIDVSEINEVRNLKDHAWNAVYVNDEWKLLDITWSTGRRDRTTGKWIRKVDDYYFFTPPHIFNATHYPECSFWQLTEKAKSLQDFFNTPMLYREYFESGIDLREFEKGLIELPPDVRKLSISFHRNPSKRPELYYKFAGERYLKQVRVKKDAHNQYTAVVPLGKRRDNILTIYLKNKPLMGFKVGK